MEWFIGKLWCSSIISYNITSIAHNHHTNLPSFKHINIYIYLNSVNRFSKEVKQKFNNRVDILINNAGSIPEEGMRTKQGLEMAFGAMHIGHYALTKNLLPSLLTPLPASEDTSVGSSTARVVYVSSEAGVLSGKFHESFVFGNGTGKFEGVLEEL